MWAAGLEEAKAAGSGAEPHEAETGEYGRNKMVFRRNLCELQKAVRPYDRSIWMRFKVLL